MSGSSPDGTPPALPGRGRNVIELLVPPESGGARLDRFVAGAAGVSRSELKHWIDAGCVTVDGAQRQAGSRLHPGQRILVVARAPARANAEPDSEIRFDVLHVDPDVVVVMKPAGLVVHPAAGHAAGTLVNGLLGRGLFRSEDFLDGSDASGHARPGIVHRLDKGTSGLMVVARSPEAREALKTQFQEHTIDRAYEAIVVGNAASRTIATLHGRDPRDRFRFTGRVTRGKPAVTHVHVLGSLTGATYVRCTLETGRTHQIRVHLAESGTPVLGDPLYGKAAADSHVRAVGERLGHQALHARLLGFVHPRTGVRLRFESEPPADFLAALQELTPPQR